ncbi:TolC family protein [Flavobacterium azooxidireducens]|uniref:TolC family protein n=1 Tax=Flavobacterium azooxidireducens TaxID=1871076 RepID=A0ABY4KB03_9FLAO|nr:TolC family protein [Flavobacterium azooxidireducens]UPQ77971.1 TolC family protein [Flavobacterium azooxidireducens]
MKKWLMVCLGLLSVSASSQIYLSDDVYKAVNLALHKDVELENQRLDVKKLDIERKSILSKYIPKVEANALYGYINSNGNLDIPTISLPIAGFNLFQGSTDFSTKGQAFNGGVVAKAVLFSGGQIYNGAKALAYKNKGNALMIDVKSDEVIKDIILSYDQLQLLNAAEKLIDESEKRLKKESERVEKAISLGLAIPYDRDKIKLAILELETKRIEVEHKKQLLTLKINQATGLSIDEIVSAKHNVSSIVILEDLSNENRKEIKALEAYHQATEFVIKKEKGSLLPTLGAFGGYSYTSLFNTEFSTNTPITQKHIDLKVNHLTLNPTWMVGVAMKWELFSGFERIHKIEEATISDKQMQNNLNDAKEKTALQLQKNKLDYETALLQIDIAKQREVIAKNNNSLAEKQYKAGLIGVTERISAENDVYKEALNKIETIIKQRQIAIETFQSAGSLSTYIISK